MSAGENKQSAGSRTAGEKMKGKRDEREAGVDSEESGDAFILRRRT